MIEDSFKWFKQRSCCWRWDLRVGFSFDGRSPPIMRGELALDHLIPSSFSLFSTLR